jgi:hypothetical protein
LTRGASLPRPVTVAYRYASRSTFSTEGTATRCTTSSATRATAVMDVRTTHLNMSFSSTVLWPALTVSAIVPSTSPRRDAQRACNRTRRPGLPRRSARRRRASQRQRKPDRTHSSALHRSSSRDPKHRSIPGRARGTRAAGAPFLPRPDAPRDPSSRSSSSGRRGRPHAPSPRHPPASRARASASIEEGAAVVAAVVPGAASAPRAAAAATAAAALLGLSTAAIRPSLAYPMSKSRRKAGPASSGSSPGFETGRPRKATDRSLSSAST